MVPAMVGHLPDLLAPIGPTAPARPHLAGVPIQRIVAVAAVHIHGHVAPGARSAALPPGAADVDRLAPCDLAAAPPRCVRRGDLVLDLVLLVIAPLRRGLEPCGPVDGGIRLQHLVREAGARESLLPSRIGIHSLHIKCGAPLLVLHLQQHEIAVHRRLVHRQSAGPVLVFAVLLLQLHRLGHGEGQPLAVLLVRPLHVLLLVPDARALPPEAVHRQHPVSNPDGQPVVVLQEHAAAPVLPLLAHGELEGVLVEVLPAAVARELGQGQLQEPLCTDLQRNLPWDPVVLLILLPRAAIVKLHIVVVVLRDQDLPQGDLTPEIPVIVLDGVRSVFIVVDLGDGPR
mmetsp:Transcript_40246/g.65875  ORF Transcript_40246/g.65875 Transcript_40246/m.65875 type:complete len:343 (-) Transcript_40246:923-1951(-)